MLDPFLEEKGDSVNELCLRNKHFVLDVVEVHRAAVDVLLNHRQNSIYQA